MIFWDEQKSTLNFKKNGLDFNTAQEVFNDPLHLSILDARFECEERWITVGDLKGNIIVVVAHTYMDIGGEERIRIISARKATRNERKQYENYEI